MAMSLKNDIKFQKTLAQFAGASNEHEVAAAERAARRVMEAYKIDPTDMPDRSLYNHMNFTDSPLLQKLREEWIAAHPPKPKRTRKVKNNPLLSSTKGLFDRLFGNKEGANEPPPEPDVASADMVGSRSESVKANRGVNTPRQDQRKGDRHRPRKGDRHKPGYMAEYMRKRRAEGKAAGVNVSVNTSVTPARFAALEAELAQARARIAELELQARSPAARSVSRNSKTGR
jgi:hypothetical protein